MARKESTTQFKESIPTIIGAGITEKWYFTHLQAKYRVRMKIRPRFFGKETVFTLEKKLMEVLKNGGRAIVVFDADVSTWNKAEKERPRTTEYCYVTVCHLLSTGSCSIMSIPTVISVHPKLSSWNWSSTSKNSTRLRLS